MDLKNTQKHISWLSQKLYLDNVSNKAKSRLVKRGQVYYCDFGHNIGSEIRKKRPCVIIQNDIGNLKSANTVVIPISSNGGHKSLENVIIQINSYKVNNNLTIDGYINTTQVRTVSKARLGDYLCDLKSDDLRKVEKALARELELMKHFSDLESKFIEVNKKYKDLQEKYRILELELEHKS